MATLKELMPMIDGTNISGHLDSRVTDVMDGTIRCSGALMMVLGGSHDGTN
jgi:hypothetical protein